MKAREIRALPAYWGRWFWSVSDSNMKSTNLNVFLKLGSSIQMFVQQAHVGQEWDECFLYSNYLNEWLTRFLAETKEYQKALRDSRAAVQGFLDALNHVFSLPQENWKRPITQEEITAFIGWRDSLEESFERERRKLQVFVVTPKGTRDTEILIENPESDLPEHAIPILPDQFMYDLKQAARCLAFDIPTACAFHVCRATESLMLAYYKLLSGHDWQFKKKDWKIYIEQLTVEKAPKRITDRLDEIRDMDRNAYTHPEENVSLDEAKVLYSLCIGVNYYMCEEMVKLTP